MTGTARIFVSIVMEWKDPRLAWEINEENCADYINVYTGYDQGTYNKVVAAVVVIKNRNETNYKKKYKYQKKYLLLTLIMYRFSSFIYLKSETASIWIPDFDLLNNQVENVQGFAASQAVVSSDGTVTWGHS